MHRALSHGRLILSWISVRLTHCHCVGRRERGLARPAMWQSDLRSALCLVALARPTALLCSALLSLFPMQAYASPHWACAEDLLTANMAALSQLQTWQVVGLLCVHLFAVLPFRTHWGRLPYSSSLFISGLMAQLDPWLLLIRPDVHHPWALGS